MIYTPVQLAVKPERDFAQRPAVKPERDKYDGEVQIKIDRMGADHRLQ